MNEKTVEPGNAALIRDLKDIIQQARLKVAQSVDSALVILYWRIGRRIQDDILKQERAAYGGEIVATLSQQLTAEYGRCFSRYNLARMIQFAEVFPDEQIVATLSQDLSWSHFVQLFPLKDRLKQEFYAEMARVERWSVRTLRTKMGLDAF